MKTNQRKARIAGLLYFFVAISGGFAHFSVRKNLINSGNDMETANNILASETLFRIGTVSDLACQLAFIFLPLILYRILKPINKSYSVLMVILALVGVPIACLNMVNQFAGLHLLSSDYYLATLGKEQQHALVMLFFNLQNYGILIAQIFWGLWLFPLGLLVFSSGFFPKMLGVLLMIAAIIYAAGSFISLLFPDMTSIIEIFYYQPAITEISFCFWLLIKGVNYRREIFYRSSALS